MHCNGLRVRRRRAMVVAAAMVGVSTMPVLGALPGAGADAGCSTATLAGGYGMAGEGVLAGAPLAIIGRFVFDGAGKVSGYGTAILDSPSAVETYALRDGTYKVREDCTGTMRFFVLHKTLPPIDHFHDVEFVLADGGKQFSMLFVTLEPREGTSVPIENVLWSGHRQ